MAGQEARDSEARFVLFMVISSFRDRENSSKNCTNFTSEYQITSHLAPSLQGSNTTLGTKFAVVSIGRYSSYSDYNEIDTPVFQSHHRAKLARRKGNVISLRPILKVTLIKHSQDSHKASLSLTEIATE